MKLPFECIVVLDAAVRIDETVLDFTIGSPPSVAFHGEEKDARADHTVGHQLVREPRLYSILVLAHYVLAKKLKLLALLFFHVNPVESNLVLLVLAIIDGLHGEGLVLDFNQVISAHVRLDVWV